jgi:hypothetical protein
VAIALIARMLPLKVEDTLFFPRIPDGGVVPKVIEVYITGARKERKTR